MKVDRDDIKFFFEKVRIGKYSIYYDRFVF